MIMGYNFEIVGTGIASMVSTLNSILKNDD
jgi:hypothetical protein